ncbi:hypothetical protein LINPERPRIM_LOCUS40808, partial [Linum perenne]
AFNSITDIFNAKATCKLLSQFGSERYVLQNAAVLDKYFCRRYRGDRHKADYSRFMAQCIDRTRKRCSTSESMTTSTVTRMRELKNVIHGGEGYEGLEEYGYVLMESNMWVNGDRWTGLEMNDDVIRQCGCVGKLRYYSKNPYDFGWMMMDEEFMEVIYSSLYDYCFSRLLFFVKDLA